MLYSLLPVLMLAAILEITARVAEIWHPPIPADIGLGFTPESRLFIPRPHHPGSLITNPNKAIPRNQSKLAQFSTFFLSNPSTVPFLQQTFRLPKAPKTFRIFFLGGSSVHYADAQLQEMARRLEKRFPVYETVELINCGGCAYGSHRLVFILAEVLQYEPDAICLYLGNNEFEEQEQLRFAHLDSLPLQKLISQSAVLRTLRDRISLFEMQRIFDARNQQIMGNRVVPWNDMAQRSSPDEISRRMEAFRANLELMVQMIRACGTPLIMGTIPSNLIEPELLAADTERYASEVLPKFASGDYEEGMKAAQAILTAGWRHQASDLENGHLRAVIQQYGVPFADVLAKVSEREPRGVPGETLFSDHCHLNGDGKNILASAFEEKLAELLAAGDL